MTANTVLITGCNRGLGLEMVRQYASHGWKVHACARSLDDAVELQALASAQPAVQLHTLDVTQDSDIEKLAESLAGEPLDLLINNAGVYGPKGLPMEALDRQTWLDVLNVNTVSPLMVTRALLPNLRAAGSARVAIVSSKMGSMDDNTSGGSYIYRSGKSAVNAVGKSLSVDLKDEGIAVVVLHPGWVLTDMGGPSALITAMQSVDGMRNVIDGLTLENSGRFVAFDGKAISW